MECPGCKSVVGEDWLICPQCGKDIGILPKKNDLLSDLNTKQNYNFDKNERFPPKISISKRIVPEFNKSYFFIIVVVILLVGGIFLSNVANSMSPSLTATPSPSITVISTKTPTKTPTLTSSPTFQNLPEFTVRFFNQEKDSELQVVWSEKYIPSFSWPYKPGDYSWELEYPSNTSILIYTGWCALTKEILDENFKSLEYAFAFDGFDISDKLEIFEDNSQMEGVDWACVNYLGVIDDSHPGKHVLVHTQKFLNIINDGKDDYQKGNITNTFTINIK